MLPESAEAPPESDGPLGTVTPLGTVLDPLERPLGPRAAVGPRGTTLEPRAMCPPPRGMTLVVPRVARVPRVLGDPPRVTIVEPLAIEPQPRGIVLGPRGGVHAPRARVPGPRSNALQAPPPPPLPRVAVLGPRGKTELGPRATVMGPCALMLLPRAMDLPRADDDPRFDAAATPEPQDTDGVVLGTADWLPGAFEPHDAPEFAARGVAAAGREDVTVRVGTLLLLGNAVDGRRGPLNEGRGTDSRVGSCVSRDLGDPRGASCCILFYIRISVGAS